MGVTKTNLFTDPQNNLAAMAKVLGHPARIAILEILLKSDTCINSTLVNELGLAQATISQHLKELKNSGLIQGTIDGKAMSYCINPKSWQNLKDNLNQLFNQHSCCSDSNCC
ncbi:MAG: ArsR/SmtB family transcription factor [Crocinitomicaceae bacterium]